MSQLGSNANIGAWLHDQYPNGLKFRGSNIYMMQITDFNVYNRPPDLLIHVLLKISRPSVLLILCRPTEAKSIIFLMDSYLPIAFT